jgi:putative phosphoribosyl transferase
MIFKSREEAALLLLKELKDYKGLNPLVLAIPRGAIKMAAIIQEGLEGELGVILVHKIGAPGNAEFAIASVGLSGIIYRQSYIDQLSIPDFYVQAEGQRQFAILKERFKNYGLDEKHYKTLYTDRIIIIVDDGIATGATVLSAIQEVRTQKPKKIIVAAAVASTEAAEKIQAAAEEVVILHVSEEFYAVSQFYKNFFQISDEEVIRTLKKK